MAGNTFGQAYTVTTFGESHGIALGAIVDGCPPGLPLTEHDIQVDLERRRTGLSRFTSQRRESDQIQILSGVFEGKTTGTPIGLCIVNADAKSKDYANIKDQFRPGHADYTYFRKYGIRDYRGGGRSSARETVMRVAAGAIARKYLFEHYQLVIRACVDQIGDIAVNTWDWDHVNQNPFFSPDPDVVAHWEKLINQLRKEGDSIGAGITLLAEPMPVGLGEPVFHKLNADLASALMGINAVKGVEIGSGFLSIRQRGSEHRDPLTPQGFTSNHAGGILGGISSGQPLSLRVALKPASSIIIPVDSINTAGEPCTVVTKGRHDPCVGIRAVPIVEAMVAIVLMDHVLRQRAQNPGQM